MPKDNGTLWALGAAAALAGAAALGRRRDGERGSRNPPGPRKLRFLVNPLVKMRCPPVEPMPSEVDVLWSGDPADLPSREEVLEAWRRDQNASDDQSAQDVAWEVVHNRIQEEPAEWTDFSIEDSSAWHIEPVVQVRRGLGGRKHLTAAGHPVTMEQVNRYQSATHDSNGKPR